ncbi:unnamed protein product [Lactuca virosa]|uniref:Zinc finger GRF-type domain-containing protein n=1 Tax=Lactuca virosa TaxID=75947 RepID=A0AAU9PC80_9ASTR|nr:unnamed protein product [Lactuca virosa]
MISNDGCNFFEWLDPALPKHYKDTLWNMKLRIDDLLVRNDQVVELQKKVEKHKLLRKAEKELAEARIQELLIEIERCFLEQGGYADVPFGMVFWDGLLGD